MTIKKKINNINHIKNKLWEDQKDNSQWKVG